MAQRKPCIGVIGGSDGDKETLAAAHEIGRLIAQRGALLVCGGLGGVMEAASRGADECGGTVIGIIPSSDRGDANAHVSVVIPSGMGIARNALVVQTADVLIALPGAYGTLSEIALALSLGKPVVHMPGSWNLSKIGKVDAAQFKEAVNPGHAVGLALDMLIKKPQ